MSVPTTSQLSSQRTAPLETALQLVIHEPDVMFTAQVNSADIAKGATTIPYDNSTGDAGLLRRNYTMYVGSTAGARDKGRIRIRSAGGGNIEVGRNDHIKWEDNLYLTVVRFIEPWGVFHRIVLDSDDNPIFYKDNDIVYTDQNEQMAPVVCMGQHTALYQGESIDWHTSGSYSPTADALSTAAWTFNGGTPSSSAAFNPGPVAYHTPGHYEQACTITDANGKSTTGARYVTVLANPESGIQSWGLTSLEGDRGQGGWRAGLWIKEQREIVEGSLVWIVAQDWYNGVKQAIPFPTVFCGYIQDKSVSFDWKTSKISFNALSITGVAAGRETYGVALDSVDVGDDTNWTQMPNMTTDKALVNYLYWNTTLLEIADFHPVENTYLKMFGDLAHGPIYGTADSFLFSNLLARLVADCKGALWAETDINYIPSGSRAHETALSMTRRDWRGQPDFERILMPPVSYVELGGVAYSGGTSGTFTPYLSGAPGVVPAYQGSPQRVTGLALLDQDQLNVLSGNFYADASMQYPRVTFPMAGAYRFIDIAPQERVAITLDADDTYEGVVWNDKFFIPQAITRSFDVKKMLMTSDITMKEETSGFPGDTIIIPVDPPDGEDPGVPGEPGPSGELVYVMTGAHLGRTRNFSAASPNWENVTGGLAGGSSSVLKFFCLDPYDPRNAAVAITEDEIWVCQDLDSTSPTWVRKATLAQLTAAITGAFTLVNYELCNVNASIAQDGLFYVSFHAQVSSGGTKRLMGVFRTTDMYDTYSMQIIDGPTVGAAAAGCYVQASNYLAEMAFAVGVEDSSSGQTKVWKTSNGGSSWSSITPGTIAGTELACGEFAYAGGSATLGERIMYVYEALAAGSHIGDIHRSTDGGASWSEVFNPTYAGAWASHSSQSVRTLINVATWQSQDIVAVIPVNSTVHLVRSTDGGDNWTDTTLSGAGWTDVHSMGRWPYNPEWIYLLNANSIRFSRNGGTDFTSSDCDKSGDWVTAMGGSLSSCVHIVPVWVV